MSYSDHYIGESVQVFSNGSPLFSGVITRMGSCHASVTDLQMGVSHDITYSDIGKYASISKTANSEIIKETEESDRQFVLSKNTENIDGSIHVKYEVTVDNEPIWESEELVTSVYDTENGWSTPDDFDDNKLDLIEQSASAGFDLLVDSYTNIQENIEAQQQPATDSIDGGEDGDADTPKGEPAFAPGEEPDDFSGGGGGATMIGGEDVDLGEEGDISAEDGDLIEDNSELGAEDSDVGGADAFAEQPSEDTTAASLEKPSYARSILADKVRIGGDDRLHGNPQHRLNPALREEMKRRKIPSGYTNDIELSKQLKDFDYSKPKGAAINRLSKKLDNLK